MTECGLGKTVFHTSLGWVGVSLSEEGICRIVLPRTGKKRVERELNGGGSGVHGSQRGAQNISRILAKTVELLRRYFSGERVSFDLPLDLRYYTPFQQSVWRATAEIPRGETRSYGWIATRIKNPRAARAVGRALGANPVPVLVP
jgi:O6-methylguanine-DNA--protein-cysteine methyltransferase